MAYDVGTEQARRLLSELYGHVEDVSRKLEAADERNRRSRARGNPRKDPIASVLRRDLYETHRLIDGLHRRFPATAPTPTRTVAQDGLRHRRAG